MRRATVFTFAVLAIPSLVSAQVPYERLLRADDEPGSWLTYSGITDLSGSRASTTSRLTT